MQVSSFNRLAALSAGKPNQSQNNPFSANGNGDGGNFAWQSNGFTQQANLANKQDPTADNSDQLRDEQLKQLTEMIQLQQQEMEKLQQVMLQEMQKVGSNPGAVQNFASALEGKSSQLANLQNSMATVATSGQIGGMVARPLETKVNFMA